MATYGKLRNAGSFGRQSHITGDIFALKCPHLFIYQSNEYNFENFPDVYYFAISWAN